MKKEKKYNVKKIKSLFSATKERLVIIFHTVLGFRLIKLPEGVDVADAGTITPSGFIINHPVLTYIINR